MKNISVIFDLWTSDWPKKQKTEETAAISKEKLLDLYSFYLPFYILEDESLNTIRW